MCKRIYNILTMTKDEMTKLHLDGYTILRALLDARKQMYKIVKHTNTFGGGWARFGDFWYYTRKDADDAIDHIVENNPGMKYAKDK